MSQVCPPTHPGTRASICNGRSPALTPRLSHAGKADLGRPRQAGPGHQGCQRTQPAPLPREPLLDGTGGAWGRVLSLSSQDRGPTWTGWPLPDPAAHQAWFLCCPGGLPKVLRAVLASLGGCSPMLGQMPVQPQTDIDQGMAAVAQAGWFAFKGCLRKSTTPLLRKL